MALYRALRRGQIHLDATPAKRGDDVLGERRVVKIVEPGEIFEFHGKKPGTWMVPVDVQEDDDEPAGDDKPGTPQGESGGRHGTRSTSRGSPKEPAGDDKP